jgi:hypothetical protein
MKLSGLFERFMGIPAKLNHKVVGAAQDFVN